jgi:uncharacterized protein YdcH (DUF465 family)
MGNLCWAAYGKGLHKGDSMPIQNHNLTDEFPELRDKIHQLKVSNPHFHKLMSDYDLVEHEVRNIENAGQNTSDDYLEELRKKRLNLKDQLYKLLNAA